MRQLIAIITICALGLVAVPPRALAAGEPTRVAVMELESLLGDDKLATTLSEVLLDEVGTMPGLEVVGMSEIHTMLSFDQQRMLAGCDEEVCLAEVAGALGVDQLVTGQLSKLGQLWLVSAKLFDVGQARVLRGGAVYTSNVHSYYRNHRDETTQPYTVGIRCC